ncbi:peptidyl-prolyl cis-trans isomerase [Paludibacterium purpuratum]|uniref:Periplasmic chaperone PpiD n=1 Tax=Paludibacterium purpuratum TaxID=1144873 RepID=A0A4R7B5A0_9NEIS|nr:peptidyl-prolyl cis-trans isomerase [Paludibacterium purpuratum]TDR79771.1 peptidyl-prolyl cis-trans isomerase D [Paludibacterium purpuratum]
MFKFVENNKVVIQVILGLVALTFVGFGVSSYSSVAEDPYLVKVGKINIALRDIDRELDGQPVDAAAKQRALEGLIQRNLILNETESNGLHVAPMQLQQAIASIPAFQDNGQFSLDKYKAFLDKRQMTGPQFEERIGRDLLVQSQMGPFAAGQISSRALVDRLGQMLGESRVVSAMVLTPPAFASQVKLDDATIAAYYKANADKFKAPEAVKLSYVVLSQAQLAQNLSVGDDELRKFYQQHLADFGQEQRRASHILLTVPQGAAPAEVARIKTEAAAILKQVRANPSSFDQVARTRSQDPGSATKGGDLGFFARGTMVKAFDDVVFQMKPGQISEVVRSEFGFHIIRLDEVKQPGFDAVKDQVAQQVRLQKAGALYRSQSDTLTEVAYQQGDSLKGVQDALKLVPQQSGWVARTATGNDPILSNPKVLAAAFSNDVLVKKHNSEPIDLGNNATAVIRVTDHQPAHQLKLDEVRDAIKMQLIATDGAKLATAKGQALLADLKAGKPAAGQWTQPRELSRQQNLGLPLADLQAIFALGTAKLPTYAGLKRATGEYVIYRVESIKPAPALTPEQHAQLSGIVDNMNANAQITGYLQWLRTKYPVLGGKQKLNQTSDE